MRIDRSNPYIHSTIVLCDGEFGSVTKCQTESESDEKWFSVDSNPYIHSTTVLCDTCMIM